MWVESYVRCEQVVVVVVVMPTHFEQHPLPAGIVPHHSPPASWGTGTLFPSVVGKPAASSMRAARTYRRRGQGGGVGGDGCGCVVCTVECCG